MSIKIDGQKNTNKRSAYSRAKSLNIDGSEKMKSAAFTCLSGSVLEVSSSLGLPFKKSDLHDNRGGRQRCRARCRVHRSCTRTEIA